MNKDSTNKIKNSTDQADVKCYEFTVKGMHCAACEILIEDKLKSVKGVKNVEAKLNSGKVIVEIHSQESEEDLAKDFTNLVKDDGYKLFAQGSNPTDHRPSTDDFFYAIPIALIFILAFLLLQKIGILNTTFANSNLLATFIIGVIASLSSCSAVVGGLVLTLSSSYAKSNSKRNLFPHFAFHISRLVSFFLLGGVLGLIGFLLKPTPLFTFILTIAVSLFMLILGISMIFPIFSKYQLRTPKSLSKQLLQVKNLNNYLVPILLGLVTFFLPCGFTQTMQLQALEKGNFIEGGILMLVFALGTLPVLALLSFASVNFAGKMRSGVFYKVAGLVVVAFAIYSIYNVFVLNGVV